MYAVSEMRIQDPIFIIIRSPGTTLFFRFTIHVSRDPILSDHDQAGAGIALSVREERVVRLNQSTVVWL